MTLRITTPCGLAALLLSTALATPLWAQGTTEVRSTSGDSVPAPGEDLLIFDDFTLPQINNAGQIAFRAITRSLTSPTPFASLWLDDSLIVRQGFSPPGYNANLVAIDAVRLNNTGDVAYSGNVEPNLIVWPEFSRAIWVNNQLVARTGFDNPLPSFNDVTQLSLLDIADGGRIFLRATDGLEFVRAVALDPATGGSFSFIVADGETINISGAATGTFLPFNSSLGSGALDAQGRMAVTLDGILSVPGQSAINGLAIVRAQAGGGANAQLVAM